MSLSIDHSEKEPGNFIYTARTNLTDLNVAGQSVINMLDEVQFNKSYI